MVSYHCVRETAAIIIYQIYLFIAVLRLAGPERCWQEHDVQAAHRTAGIDGWLVRVSPSGHPDGILPSKQRPRPKPHRGGHAQNLLGSPGNSPAADTRGNTSFIFEQFDLLFRRHKYSVGVNGV